MLRVTIFIAILLMGAILASPAAVAQASASSEDPLLHGHALLVGNAHYSDGHWAQLEDIPFQLERLQEGLQPHFDTVDVEKDLDVAKLKGTIEDFLKRYGNDENSRLFIYYAGHGYSELIRDRNELRGYITGIDTPSIDGSTQAYDTARPKSISMEVIRADLVDARAKSILFVFDSCFAGTFVALRSSAPERQPMSKERVAQLMEKPAREIITAGSANETVPAHSPIPELLLAAINGEADPFHEGVVTAADIREYLLVQIHDLKLTPQEGKLNDPAFAEGSFLFRVINPEVSPPTESETIRLYREKAEKGNATAQVQLGYLYEKGLEGLQKNEREAARLYRLAAAQGNAQAQSNLGGFYEHGVGGLPKNNCEAARLYKASADQGNPQGRANLGTFYERGLGGLPKYDGEAARLYKLAADQGDPEGQAHLGLFRATGRGGLAKDDYEAARLFKLAANQGNAVAEANLGVFYENGRGGLSKDDYEAARLFKLAADQGNAAGQAHLGLFYQMGRGGLEKDDRGAARLFKLAANQGNAIGQANIGVPFLDRVEKEARLDRARLEVSASKPFFNETDPLDIRFAAGEPRALYCWVLDSDVTAAVFLPIRGIEATRMLMPGERHYPSGFGLDEVRLDEPRVNLIDCFAARTRLPPELDARWLEAAPSKETDYNPEPLSAPDVLELLNKMRALPGIVEGTARLVVR